MTAPRRTLSLALVGAIALAGCSDTVPPLQVIDLDGDLEGIGAHVPVTSDGFLSVMAYPVNLERVLAPHERVGVSVTTSRGDSEIVLLQRGICESGSEGAVQCQSFLVGLRDGRSPAELDFVASSVNARLNRIGSSTTLVGHAFGSLSTAMRQLSTHPAVSFVEFNHIVSVVPLNPSIEPVRMYTQMHGALPLTTSTVNANNGRLSVAAGDVITLTFQQPTGATLTATVTVQ